MASKNESATGTTPEDAPEREDFADFALVLKNGQELKCHKIKLAEVSPVFCAMLKKNCIETQTNKMKVTEFEPDTVDYIYADLELVPDQKVYKRSFDEKRLTPELLRMCHMYRIKNLQEKCIEHLKNNIKDANAVDIWTVAETVGNAELKEVALDYFGKNLKKLPELPGLEESFLSPQLVKSLFTSMAARMIPGPTQPSDKVITIFVQSTNEYTDWLGSSRYCGKISVKLSDTVETLRLKITDWLSQRKARARCKKHSCSIPGGNRLEENITLESYNLSDGTSILCDLETY